LKEAHKSQNLADIDTFTAELNTAFQAASQDMYNAANAQTGGAQGNPFDGANNPFGGDAGNPFGAPGGESKGGKKGDDVTDVDFEEVK
jgi:molecular chaperone DnaK